MPSVFLTIYSDLDNSLTARLTEGFVTPQMYGYINTANATVLLMKDKYSFKIILHR